MSPAAETRSAPLPAPLRLRRLADAAVAPDETVDFHMTRTVITLAGSDPASRAFETMAQYRIGCLPVLSGGRLLGVVTEQDLIRAVAEGRSLDTPVNRLCLSAPCVAPRASIRDAITRMRREHLRYLLVADGRGRLAGLVSQTDVLEASRRILARTEARSARAETIAYRDPVTGLYTRRALEESLEAEFRRAQRYGGLLAVALLDIDRFKRVNDRFGHAAGDAVLARLGRIIRRRARPVDLAARYGGEEIALLLPESGTRAGRILAECVRKEFSSRPFRQDGRAFTVTLSGGVAKWSDRHRGPAELLAEADAALYRAKRAGRNRIEVSP